MKPELLADGAELIIGQVYTVKMRGTGKRVQAKFNGKQEHRPFGGNLWHEARTTYTYSFTSLETGRDIYTRSKQVISK